MPHSPRRSNAQPKLTVETLEARDVPAVFTVTNANDSGAGSLRQAMTSANAMAGLDSITFNIPGSGLHTILLATALPSVTEAVSIDASTEPGYVVGVPTVAIDGGVNRVAGFQFTASASHSTLRGFAIYRFNAAVAVHSADSVVIAGNRIGVTADGTAAGGGFVGIIVTNTVATDKATNVTIGGAAARDRNIVSDATTFGIYVEDAINPLIQNNYVGTNVAGTAAVPNRGDGITVNSHSTGARVVGNLVSGNTGVGVNLDSTKTTSFRGNKVGVNATGTGSLANGGAGVIVQAGSDITIGGSLSSEKNVISANGGAGIIVRNGVTRVTISGNAIGTDASGTINLGNAGDGVSIRAGANAIVVGGSTTPTGNVILFNGGSGVSVGDASVSGVRIQRNMLHDNRVLGIDLISGTPGVTSNDSLDADTGPSGLQNYPQVSDSVLTLSSDGYLTVTGTLNSTPNRQFVIDVYASTTESSSGHGEGRRFLGTLVCNTNSAGNATFTFRTDYANQVAVSEFITLTATNAQTGDTSEFSAARVVVRPLAKGVLVPRSRSNVTVGPIGSPVDADGNANAWITSLPTVGTLCLDDVPIQLGQVIRAIDLDRLCYDAPAGTDEPSSEFTYRLGIPSGFGDTEFTEAGIHGFGDTEFTEAGTDLQVVITEFSIPSMGQIGTPVFLATGDDNLDVVTTFDWTITAPDGSSFHLDGEQTSFTPTQLGQYTVHLNATDDRGIAQSQSGVIDVRQVLPVAVPYNLTWQEDTVVHPGIHTAVGDVNGDGVADRTIGSNRGEPSLVTIIDGATGATIRSFSPFEASFTGGVRVAVGDVNGDGIDDLAVSADIGGGGRVQIYDGVTGEKWADFMGIDDDAFRGGTQISLGDVDGDGFADLAIAAGEGGGPRIALFDGRWLRAGITPQRLVDDFFAFEATQRGGATIAIGDLNGDGLADLIIGGGPGGGPRLLGLDASALLLSAGDERKDIINFFVDDATLRNGVQVAVKNLDGDYLADVVVDVPTAEGTITKSYFGKSLTVDGTLVE